MLAEIKIKARNPDCIRVIQITDTHIFESADDGFDGVNTTASLNAVIEHIRQQEEQADLVLVTGDLVHDPVAEAYLKLRQQLIDLHAPTFCLPGNHDNPELMHSLLNKKNVHTNKLVQAGEWGIVLLDTYLANSHAGRLKREELDKLEQSLEQLREKFVLVCLHHPPVPVASPWMDTMMLENPDDLFSVLDKYNQVRGLVWGHIHQVFKKSRGEVILYGSPSTCVQFKPNADEYIRDNLGPGYSILLLNRDGSVEISTERI